MGNSSCLQSGGGLLRKYTHGGTSRDWSHVWREETGGAKRTWVQHKTQSWGLSWTKKAIAMKETYARPHALFCCWVILLIASLLSSLWIPVAWQLQNGSNMWTFVILDLTLQLPGQCKFKAHVLVETFSEKSMYFLRTMYFGPLLFLTLHVDVY